MIFLCILIAGFVVVSFVVTHALAKEVMRLEQNVIELNDSISELKDSISDTDEWMSDTARRVRKAEVKLSSHGELIVLAHAKFDRLNPDNASVGPQRITPTPIPTIQAQTARAERDLKDATTSP